jgi:myo-inositol-1(or 4)-monophosphatase
VPKPAGEEVRTGVPPPGTLETIAIGAVAEGARLIREAAGKLGSVRMKSSPTDPVTALDVEVEQAIRESLQHRTPGASFLGEEHGDSEGKSPLGWVLDPIDGTVNLTYDLPVVGVSLAATVDGEVVAGAVADVLRNEIFSASAGLGARRDGSTIGPTAVVSLADALVATGFAYSADRRARETEWFRRVLPAARDVRCFGSSALHLCWVACGRLDAFYQRSMERWDFAAGALIARESGARVAYPTAGNGELLIAASPRVFEALLELVA